MSKFCIFQQLCAIANILFILLIPILSMKVKILISSYVSSIEREKCIKELFKSILASIKYFLIDDRIEEYLKDINLEILVSYSCSYNQCNVYEHISTNMPSSITMHLYKHDLRMYQFEGYLFLSKFVNDDDIVIFSDDDDIFHPHRISDIINIFWQNDYQIVEHDNIGFGNITSNVITYEELMQNENEHTFICVPEYFRFAMKGNIYKSNLEFYKKTTGNALSFFDIIFAHHVDQDKNTVKSFHLAKVLQYHRHQSYKRDFYVK